MVALYGWPADPDRFRSFYLQTHLQLAARLPGDSRYSFAVQGVGAKSPHFCVWEGEFADEAAMSVAVGFRSAAEVLAASGLA